MNRYANVCVSMQDILPNKQLMTSKEVEYFLNISRRTLYKMIERGQLNPNTIKFVRDGKEYKIYRFDPDDINKLIGEV